MLDRIADVEPDIGGLGYRDGFLGAAPRYAPGIGVDEDFADRQPGQSAPTASASSRRRYVMTCSSS